MEICIDVQLTPEMQQKGSTLYAKRPTDPSKDLTFSSKVISGMVGIMLAVGMIVGGIYVPKEWVTIFMPLAAAALIGAFLALIVIWRVSLALQKQNFQKIGSMKYIFREDSIDVETTFCRTNYPWTTVSEAVYDTKNWLLVLKPRNEILILDSSTVSDELRRLITSKVSKVIDVDAPSTKNDPHHNEQSF